MIARSEDANVEIKYLVKFTFPSSISPNFRLSVRVDKLMDISKLTGSVPVDIDFTTSEQAFYFDINSYNLNEMNSFTLFLNEKKEDDQVLNFCGKILLATTDDLTSIKMNIPKTCSEESDKVSLYERSLQSYSLFFKKYTNSQDNTHSVYAIIYLKYTKATKNNKLFMPVRASKISVSDQIGFNKQKLTVTANIPSYYYLSFNNNRLYSTIAYVSGNKTQNCFTSNLYVTSFKLAYFEPKQNTDDYYIELYSEANDNIWITYQTTNESIIYNDESLFFTDEVISGFDTKLISDRYLIMTMVPIATPHFWFSTIPKEGYFEYYYKNDIAIDDNSNSLLTFTEEQTNTGYFEMNNYFAILKIRCFSPGYISTLLQRPVTNTTITIPLTGRSHPLEKGQSYTFDLSASNTPNLEILLLNLESASENITVDVGSENSCVLTFKSRKCRFLKFSPKTISIKNLPCNIRIDMKVIPFNSDYSIIDENTTEVKTNRALLKFNKDDILEYNFYLKFAKACYNGEDYGIGKENFIPIPNLRTYNLTETRINLYNPSILYNKRTSDEITYIYFNVENSCLPYTINTTIKNVDKHDNFKSQSLQLFKNANQFNLDLNKDYNASQFALWSFKCSEVKNVNIKLGFQDVIEKNLTTTEKSTIFNFYDLHMPLYLYLAPDSESSVTPSALISYAYLTKEQYKGLDGYINKEYSFTYDNKNKITWDSPLASIKYYVIINKKDGTTKKDLSDLCSLFNDATKIETKDNSYDLSTNKNLVDGNYDVNILGINQNSLAFAILFKQQEITYKAKTSTTMIALIIGGAILIIVVVAMVVYCMRKKHSEVSLPDKIGSLVDEETTK